MNSTKKKKLISKIQQNFKSERHNLVTEEINKIALTANDDKIMPLIDSIEAYACGTSKDIVSKIKCNNMTKQYKKV